MGRKSSESRKKERQPGVLRRFMAFALAVILCVPLTGSLAGCEEPWEDFVGEVRSLTPQPQLLQSDEGQPKLLAEDVEPVADFSVKLMQEAIDIAHEEGLENPVLSPVSAYLAMLLTACGSSGGSLEELEQLIGVSADQWAAFGSRLMKYMNWSDGSNTIQAANSVWIDDEAHIREEYLDTVSQNLYAEVFQADLSAWETVDSINRWVGNRTQGMIPQFRTEPYQENVRVSLLNAVYLEAVWSEPFLPAQSRTKSFYTAEGNEMQAEFLCDWGCNRHYVSGDGVEGILLPYAGDDLAFLALRTTDGRTVQELLDSLTGKQLKNLADSAVRTFMNFSMPKFTLEYQQDLIGALQNMGVEKSLSPKRGADFSAMGTGADGASLYVSGVGQTVKIQVDEEGTKAAAVTEVAMADGAMAYEEDPKELHFDSPYVYAVIDRESGLPLFLGLMERPPQTEGQ